MSPWPLSTPLKVGLPCLVLGILFFLVSFSVNYWVTLTYDGAEVNAGLWKACVHSKGYTMCDGWSSDNLKGVARDWIHKTQALQCLALILLLGVVGGLVVFFLTRLKAAIVSAIITCIMAAFFMILSCALFASDVNSDRLYSAIGKLDWAFGFTIVAAIFLVAAGVSLILHVLLANTNTTTTTTAAASSTPSTIDIPKS